MRFQVAYGQLTNNQLFEEFEHRLWTACDILEVDHVLVIRICFEDEIYWFSEIIQGRNIAFVSTMEDICSENYALFVHHDESMTYREVLLLLLQADFAFCDIGETHEMKNGKIKEWKNQYTLLKNVNCSGCKRNVLLEEDVLNHGWYTSFT